MNKEMSLDVALDIIGTLRMMKIDELSKETDPIKIEILEKEFNVLTIEERIAQGLEQFEGWKYVRLYNPQNEMFRLLGTKRSFSQNETFFFSHPYPPTLPFST